MGNLITVLVVLIVLAALAAVTKTPWFKGKLGEFIVNAGLRLFLSKSTYHIVRNVTLPTEDGTTQIDHIIVSRRGIFVIETKNMNGAIYGGEHQPQWTQAFGRNKYRFQNPLHQNYKHTRTLADILGVPHAVMKPIVMFIGDAKLKTQGEMPANVMTRGLIGFIKSHKEVLLSEEEVQRVLGRIEENRLARGFATDREHVRHVREIVSRKEPERGRFSAAAIAPTDRPPAPETAASFPADGPPPSCPKCGRTMVLRTVKRGNNAGGKFWGCPGYPGCRGTSRCLAQ